MPSEHNGPLCIKHRFSNVLKQWFGVLFRALFRLQALRKKKETYSSIHNKKQEITKNTILRWRVILYLGEMCFRLNITNTSFTLWRFCLHLTWHSRNFQGTGKFQLLQRALDWGSSRKRKSNWTFCCYSTNSVSCVLEMSCSWPFIFRSVTPLRGSNPW